MDILRQVLPSYPHQHVSYECIYRVELDPRRECAEWKANRGEPAIARENSRRTLVFGWPGSGPDHEAIIRFGGEAPRRRAHSNERCDDHVLARVTTTSDRGSATQAREIPLGVPKLCMFVLGIRKMISPPAAARRRAALRPW
jgi:hypothetical protein